MLKKFRRRFTSMAILMTGALTAILLSMFFSLFLIASMNSIEEELEMAALSDVSESVSSVDKSSISLVVNMVIVSTTSNGNIKVLSSTGPTISNDVIEKSVARMKLRDDGFYTLDEQGVYCYKHTESLSTRIAITSTSYFNTFASTLLIVVIIFYVLIMLLIYIITRFIVKLSLKPAEKAWEQQQNFIADASHELKTPLTVILTNTNILMAHKNDTIDNQMMWVNSTYEESTHMKDLVEKLLLLAKTDNINQKGMFTGVDISELMIRLSLQYEPIAFEKGVILTTDIQNDVIVKGEPTALNQIIHILLDNAIKYAGVGGEVTLTLRKNQKNVFITCTNTGEPIPREDLPHIFERFYRSDKARTTGNGYGLGLAICKNLIDLHKGEISCTSNSVIGTTFTLKLKEYKIKEK